MMLPSIACGMMNPDFPKAHAIQKVMKHFFITIMETDIKNNVVEYLFNVVFIYLILSVNLCKHLILVNIL